MNDIDSMNKEQLFNVVHYGTGRVGMACCADDMMLYLDTHPEDADALEYYNQCMAVLDKLKRKYESKYGLLSLCNASNLSEWNWNKEPYPWENRERRMR